jgi:thiamine pyrophosphate-dependent acetolactate synthase large subunit-like protein
VLAISGDAPEPGHGLCQITKPDLLFRDVRLYTQAVVDPAQAPKVIHQAIAAAYASRGVAHLTIPVDVRGRGCSAPSGRRWPRRGRPSWTSWRRPTNCPTCRISGLMLENAAIAEVREAVLAVTGG